MKSRFLAISLSLVLAGAAVGPTFAAPAGKSANSPRAAELSAKLADLKAQHAENERQIKRLQAKMKADADRRKTPDKAKADKDAISSLSEADLQMMQRFMAQKARLEQQISNVIKEASQ